MMNESNKDGSRSAPYRESFPRICIATPQTGALTETFIQAHIDRLPGEKMVICGSPLPDHHGSGRPLTSNRLVSRLVQCVADSYHKLSPSHSLKVHISEACTRFLRSSNVDVVLAEYGVLAAAMVEPCRRSGVPLVAHFHGYDASVISVLSDNEAAYRSLFQYAGGLIAVSTQMQNRLIGLGAPPSKVVFNCYGVDASQFSECNAGDNPPVLLAVGRFVEKKAPQLTILSFLHLISSVPDAKLRMIGDGPLLGACQDLASAFGLGDKVTFLGAQPALVVAKEMGRARAFVQHSVTARNGDMEGTPLSILEAACAGLPVIATKHGGIQDVVVDQKTGFLVNERDVASMTDAMVRVLTNPELASSMGTAGALCVRKKYRVEDSVGRLSEILCRVAGAVQ